MIFNLFKKIDTKLIVGLGNPDKQYENTRHNIGFMAVDFLHKKLNGETFYINKKFNSEISEVNKDGKKIILAKPLTFMNNSGDAVQKIVHFYKIKIDNITVLHDDLDIDFGKIKEGVGQGSAGHNGVQSIINKLKSKNFHRIRIGVGKDVKIPSDKYVLMPFKKEELEKISLILNQIII